MGVNDGSDSPSMVNILSQWSCHELRDSGQAVSIDCGLFQGLDLQGKSFKVKMHALLILNLENVPSNACYDSYSH